MNFSIVLGAACYVEGVLETLLHAILRCRQLEQTVVQDKATPDERRASNKFLMRIDRQLELDISRATGAAGYDEMFELLTGERLSATPKVKPLWESITVLFQFRNVLGHGRQVFARQYVGAIVPSGFKEEFSGGYRSVENYLHKRKLLDRKFVDGHSDFLYLSASIADHFRHIAKELPTTIIAALPETEQNACRTALRDAIAAASELEPSDTSTP